MKIYIRSDSSRRDYQPKRISKSGVIKNVFNALKSVVDKMANYLFDDESRKDTNDVKSVDQLEHNVIRETGVFCGVVKYQALIQIFDKASCDIQVVVNDKGRRVKVVRNVKLDDMVETINEIIYTLSSDSAKQQIDKYLAAM